MAHSTPPDERAGHSVARPIISEGTGNHGEVSKGGGIVFWGSLPCWVLPPAEPRQETLFKQFLGGANPTRRLGAAKEPCACAGCRVAHSIA